MKTKKELKNQKAITLIALVITIIVLLILAGVSIAMLTGDNGILTQASKAKIEQALGAVKEGIKLDQGDKRIDDINLTPEVMLADGKVTRTVQQGEDGNYYMYYALKEEAYTGMQGLGKGNLSSLKDVFLIDDNLNVRYISNEGKEYGDSIDNKILEDETKIRFASKEFSEYISQISGAPEEEMKFEWMKNRTSLKITDPNITSLEDLVFFPNLTSLTLGNISNKNEAPQITSLNGVENCQKLASIIIAFGPDKDYSALSNLSSLTYLYRLQGKDYEEIIDGIKNCENLESLYIKDQREINMSKISEISSEKIKYLDLTNNGITQIVGLDKMKNIETLNLSGNQINKIENLENLTKLTTLYLNNNKITDITPLSANTSLKSLNLKQNPGIDGNRANYTGERLEALIKIGEIIDRGGTINIDNDKLGLFTNYTNIDLSSQKLNNLEQLEGLTQLKKLILTSNDISLEDKESQEILKSMTKLEELNLTYNKVTDATAINNLKSLKYLYITGENNVFNLKEIQDIISNLEGLSISTETFKTITNCDVEKITTLNLKESELTEIPDLTTFTKLTKLDLNNNPNITNFDMVSKISSLENLVLSNNNLHGRMIDFSKLTNLTSLDLSGNTLWSEDLVNLKALKNNSNLMLNLSNNSIIDATALLELNPNTKIDLTKNINLSADSKTKLTAYFGSNVKYDK